MTSAAHQYKASVEGSGVLAESFKLHLDLDLDLDQHHKCTRAAQKRKAQKDREELLY